MKIEVNILVFAYNKKKMFFVIFVSNYYSYHFGIISNNFTD